MQSIHVERKQRGIYRARFLPTFHSSDPDGFGPRGFENNDQPGEDGAFDAGGIGGIVCDTLEDAGGRDEGGFVSVMDLREA